MHTGSEDYLSKTLVGREACLFLVLLMCVIVLDVPLIAYTDTLLPHSKASWAYFINIVTTWLYLRTEVYLIVVNRDCSTLTAKHSKPRH